MLANSSEFFNHGRKVWRPHTADDLFPVINVVANPRHKMPSKAKYDLKINDIEMRGETNICFSTRSPEVISRKVKETVEFCEKSDVEFIAGDVSEIQSTITIQCMSHSSRRHAGEQTQMLKISKKDKKIARKVYLKWSKYSDSASGYESTRNSSTKSLATAHLAIRDVYLMRKYSNLWRTFSKRDVISKIKSQNPQKPMKAENSENNSTVRAISDKDETDTSSSKTQNGKNGASDKKIKAERSLLEMQKQKIREQAVIIEELQLARLKLEEEKFARETRDLLEETKTEISSKSRCKSGPVIPIRVRQSDANKFKHSWEFVTRMEARASERRKQWESIKQRKAMMEAERIQKLHFEEEVRKKQEEEEKKEKILRLKQEKQRLAKLRKQQEEERLHLNLLNSIATEHYHKQLLKLSLNSFKLFAQQRKLMLRDAENHYYGKMLLRAFTAWKLFWRMQMREKTEKAEEFYEMCLLKKSYLSFKKLHAEYIKNYQVSADFYDFSLLKNYFFGWQMFLFLHKCDLLEKENIASQFYEINTLRRYFNNWKRFPFILFQEREKEQRLRSWCNKVQELLPDFIPSYEFY